MPKQVVHGAMLKCSFGMAPATLAVLPTNRVFHGSSAPEATIMDFAPNVNIPPFGMCQTPSNPAVAAATSAAMGVLTPQPCTPMTAAPWTPGAPKTLIGTFNALDDASTCQCTFGGAITITSPGQADETIA